MLVRIVSNNCLVKNITGKGWSCDVTLSRILQKNVLRSCFYIIILWTPRPMGSLHRYHLQFVRYVCNETSHVKNRLYEGSMDGKTSQLTARVLWQRAYQVCSLMPLIVLNDSPPRGEGSTRQYGVWLALFWDRWVVRGVTALKKYEDYAKKYEIRVLNNSYFGIKPQLGFYAYRLTMDITNSTVGNWVFCV